MFRWVPYVFVRITACFIAGILLGVYLPDSLHETVAQVSLLFLSVGYGILWYIRTKGGHSFNLGLVGLFIIFLAGYTLILLRTDSRKEDHFIHQQDTITHYKATITSYPQEKNKSWKLEAKVNAVRIDNEWRTVEGAVLFYFSKEDFATSFAYGDVLLIKGRPQLLTPPANPGEFDYKRFLSFRKIYHQHFLRKQQVTYLGSEPTNWMMKYAIQARIWSSNQLNQYVDGEREQAIASALVLGVTDGLDNEIMQAYAATGAMHVLAVSGLHVGIIYAILLFLLKPIAKRKGGKWTIALISFMTLWAYAFVTGLSPSVLRAVAMFSLVALARPLNWSTNIYNTLSLSAFCLLLYDPYLIMSVGFQLSYLAVLGIVYVQRPLYQLWEAPNVLWDKIWQITTVSIAAQLATLSLGLLYFHQFPVYFIFSNLLVIPISFAVLVLGLAVITFSFIPALAIFVGLLLTWCIKAMNGSVLLVEALPYSLLNNLYITTAQAWLIMLLLLCMALLLHFKKFSYALLATAFALAISVTQWIHFSREVEKREFIVYKIPGHQAIDFIATGSAYFLADSVLQNDHERIRFHIRPHRLISEVKSVEAASNSLGSAEKGYALVAWEGMTILIVDKQPIALPKATVDFVVISNNAVSVKHVAEKIKFKEIILDSSNSFYFAAKQRKEAEDLHIRVHSVLHEGYFTQRI